MAASWQIAARLLWRSGLIERIRDRLTRNGRFVLVFHGVASRRYPDIKRRAQPVHSADELAATLDWLQSRYAFLTPDEFLYSDRPGLLLTFDDGLANNYHHALPVLERYDAPALYFVATQHVTEPGTWLAFNHQIAARNWPDATAVPPEIAAEFYKGMTAEQVAACASHPLITIASHTISHPMLPDCLPRQLDWELLESRRILEEICGQPVTLFAYPAGQYNAAVVEAVQRAGYTAAFGVENGPDTIPKYEIPRIGLYAADPAYLGLKLSGLYRRPLAAAPVLKGNSPDK